MNKKLRYFGLLLIIAVFSITIATVWETSPAASALTSRSSFNDNHYTALYPGGPRICGDHICAPGEYDKMQQELVQAQLKGKTGTPNAPASTPSASQGQNMPSTMTGSDLGSVLKLSNANLPLVIPLEKGLYDNKDLYYITTEVSDSDIASAISKNINFPVTSAPALAKAPDAALANIYIFKNGIQGVGQLGFQPDVFDTIPGDPSYSPLWKIDYVEWKNPTNATILGSDDAIADAQSKGLITVTFTNMVKNCPIVQWGGNKDNTIPAGSMKIRDSITESGDYGSAQVLNIDTQKMQVTFVAHRGFAPDGSTIYYIATDASQNGPADALGVIFANKTQATISTSSSADLYQFSNGIKGSGPLGFQSGVASTKPGDQYYSPMWRIQVVAWKDPSMATVLENVHDITSKSDQTSTTLAGFVVNCPFFSVDTVFSHMK